ncbi:MAG: lactate utilization protein [Eubacterium sp.]
MRIDKDRLVKALKRNRYDEVLWFDTKENAAHYLDEKIQGKIVGFGDSATMETMKLNQILSENNTVIDPKPTRNNDEFLQAARICLTTEVFLTSVNAMNMDGIMVNIDGTGNRVAGSLFGHDAVYFIVGTNKVAETLDDAIWRARNIAAPKNTSRYGCKTPCVKTGKCYDCASPDRLCNAMCLYFKKNGRPAACGGHPD